MDRLEQDLRRVLRDPPGSPVTPPDIVARVHTGMARRRARRGAAAVSVLAVTALTAAGVGAVLIPDRRADSVGVVPWLDATVPPYTPSPVTPTARAVAPACRGAHLELAGVATEGAAGRAGTFVKIGNAGDSRCTLSGTPDLTGLDGTGARVRIPVESGTSFDERDTHPGPATIDPGEWAVVSIETSGSCDGPSGAATTYRQVQIRFPDRTAFDIADELSSSCPFRGGTWYPAVPPVPEPPEPWPTLRARLDGIPAAVRAGESFDYVVELANAGSAEVTLDPCPAYTEVLGRFVGDYQLDCDTVSAIPAGGTVRFAMRLDVGANAPAGLMKLWWGLHGSGVGAGAVVTVLR